MKGKNGKEPAIGYVPVVLPFMGHEKDAYKVKALTRELVNILGEENYNDHCIEWLEEQGYKVVMVNPKVDINSKRGGGKT